MKFIITLLFASVLLFANSDFSVLYKIEKGEKKLGYYEVTFTQNRITSNSYGAANKLDMFSTKEIIFIKNGMKNIQFEKNKKVENFILVTKLSALDEVTKKEYIRKFKKVKNDDMLFITKKSKKRIELFNKRKTIIKTLDELLSDIYSKKLDYNKFILFDKLGVMKMVAAVVKSSDSIVIVNASKNKQYMKINIEKGIPISIDSMVSNWHAKIIASGVFKEYKVNLAEIVSKSYQSSLSQELKNSKLSFTKVKKSKSYYELSGKIIFALSNNMQNEKTYKQKEYCKDIFKKSKVKYKKLTLNNGTCTANIKTKIKIKDLKKSILSELVKEHEQLKITKKIKFKKNSIIYEVL